MTGRFKLVCVFVLLCSLLVCGCKTGWRGSKQSRSKELATTSAEREKQQLLRRLDKKFEDPESHYQLGKVYQVDGLLTRAEHEFDITLRFDPSHRAAQAARVRTLLDMNDKSKSELLADIYMSQAASNAAHSLQLAMEFQKQHLDDYALDCYQQSLRLSPNSAKVNRQIGYYHLSRGNKEQAQNYLTRSFQLNPNQPEVAGQLGKLGVQIQVPKKRRAGSRKLDKMVEKADKERLE